MAQTRKIVGGAVGAAAVVAVCVGFTPNWEGTDHVAKYDKIGTGHPLTWCHGQTPADDKTVKPGQRFTDKQCDEYLAKSLPKYLNGTAPSVVVPIPVKSMAALVDAAYNTGPAAVRKSPMVRLFNEGKPREACDAFKGWYVRSAGQVRKGLIARRAGETIGDTRKSERALCLEGLADTKTPLYLYGASEVPEPVTPSKPAPKPVEAPKAIGWRSWFWSK